jgi:hypothetical protein
MKPGFNALARQLHRRDLFGQPALVHGGHRPLMTGEGPAVLLLTADMALVGHVGVVLAHVHLGERIEQTVMQERVDEPAVSHAVAEAGL